MSSPHVITKWALLALLVTCCAPACFGQKFVRSERSGTLVQVDASKRASYRIPQTIYGTFLEPIGNSIYPGLWAQVLENPSFEANLWSAARLRRMLESRPELATASSSGLPLPWEPLDAGQGRRYEPRWDEAANSARSLLIMALPGAETGVRQQVYLPVHRVLRYTGRLYAKHLSGPGALEVSLRRRDNPEQVFAKQVINLRGNDWGKYDFAFQLSKGQLARLEPADFVIAASDETCVFVDQALLFPADAIDGMDPDMIAMCKALRTPVVRYGGNFTSGYHWRDGVGPMDKRRTMLNQAWGMPEYNHFGTDEFLRFCELVDAEPQISLNLGSGTPEEAAGWVRYVNARWKGGRDGLLWELGNELWGTFQLGHPTIERIAQRTRIFSEALRRVDPKVTLIATGQDPDRFTEWNARQLADAPGAYEYLATHFVVRTNSVVRKDASPEFVTLSAFALPVGLERALREMRAQIEVNDWARGKVQIAFTEWLYAGRDARAPTYNNMGGAICAAGFLNTLIRVADFTPIANMTGLIEFGGVWKERAQVYGVPAYWAFRMYSTSGATWPVETTTTGDAYDVDEGNRRIPEIPEVPYLDVVGALSESGDRLVLFCVNRHLEETIPAEVRLTGFAADTAAKVQTLSATDLVEENSDADPERVVPVASSISVGSSGFQFSFPRSSVTVIELRRAGR